MTAVAAALSASRSYPASLLFGLLDQPDMPKGTVVAILAAQKARINARDVLLRAYNQEPAEKAAMFRIVADIADASLRAGTAEPPRGQGPDRAHPHHQHPGALQPAATWPMRCSASSRTPTSSCGRRC